MSNFNAWLVNKKHPIEKLKAKNGDELRRYRIREFVEIIENKAAIEEVGIDLYFKIVEKDGCI